MQFILEDDKGWIMGLFVQSNHIHHISTFSNNFDENVYYVGIYNLFLIPKMNLPRGGIYQGGR